MGNKFKVGDVVKYTKIDSFSDGIVMGRDIGRIIEVDDTSLMQYSVMFDSLDYGLYCYEETLTLVDEDTQPKENTTMTEPTPTPSQPHQEFANALRIIIADEVRKIVREVVEQRLEELEPVTKVELNELVDERINDELETQLESKLEDFILDNDIVTTDILKDSIRDCLRYDITLTVDVD